MHAALAFFGSIAVLQDCCKGEGMKGFLQKSLLWCGFVSVFTLIAVARLNYSNRDLWAGISATAADFASWLMVVGLPKV